jgi:outer membrane protein insertion porin family
LGVSYGQKSRGVEFSFTEPYFMGYRMSAGFDVFSKYTDNISTSRYESRVVGGAIRFGLPITEEIGVGIRYSIYQTQIKIPNNFKNPYNDCNVAIPGLTPTDPTIGVFNQLSPFNSCLTNGEASLAVKEAAGKTLTSLVGLNFVYNSLDDKKNPTSGWAAELKPEVAGLGGDSRFFRVTGEVRYYYPIWDDVVGLLKAQGGHIQAFGSDKLRLTDHFNPGPNLVRGFAPGGIGPRDIAYDPRSGSLGGTTYFGGTAEVQFPIWGLPKEVGLRGAVFADAGSVFNYAGYKSFNFANGRTFGVNGSPIGGCVPTNAAVTYTQGNCMTVSDQKVIRSSIGAGLLWQSPIGPVRFDYSFPITKGKYDRTQAFRFSGGGTF